ncbi:hypothetical protein SLH46_06380 [Draconibacterium sp. IB214405]|uniref:hypothetical protein n=1 Tax=Draconibacterium sp. IB214405 TaxID=3097352 RepID=UPI002A14B222|nr:hypothetical protein [Draconibacterium sp. IB214405]MDX8338799.1 hypothetical protein [Draconibacterium sp. IB214405]
MTFSNQGHNSITPPSGSNSVLTDVRNFLLHKPKIKTRIRFESPEERIAYNHRIMQRIGIKTEKYSVLNIHKIGIDAPVSYVFNELMNWNGDSTCWPNHVAKVKRKEDKIEKIKILPFGWKKYPFGLKKGFLGFHFIPLFSLNSIRIKSTPDSFDFDNARYLLYKSSGGYPIGIFAMYVRSSIKELGENSQSQLFFLVSFNFYGKENFDKLNLINRIWEGVHDRVTTNVISRIKQLCEWRIYKMEENRRNL